MINVWVALLWDWWKVTVNWKLISENNFAISTNGASSKNTIININNWAEVTSNVTSIYLPWKKNRSKYCLNCNE